MDERPCPTGKRWYPTRADAERFVDKGKSKAKRCQCGGWHVTTKPFNKVQWNLAVSKKKGRGR